MSAYAGVQAAPEHPMSLLGLQSEGDLSPQQLMEAATNWAKRNQFSPDQLQVTDQHCVCSCLC
jgi:hypothetical protein